MRQLFIIGADARFRQNSSRTRPAGLSVGHFSGSRRIRASASYCWRVCRRRTSSAGRTVSQRTDPKRMSMSPHKQMFHPGVDPRLKYKWKKEERPTSNFGWSLSPGYFLCFFEWYQSWERSRPRGMKHCLVRRPTRNPRVKTKVIIGVTKEFTFISTFERSTSQTSQMTLSIFPAPILKTL